MRDIVILCCLVLSAVSAQAAIYKWVQPDGSVVYSDRPPQSDGQEIKLPQVQTIPAAPLTGNSASSQQTAPAQNDVEHYRQFLIAAPAQDETLRENTGKVDIQLLVVPPLKPGHTITLTLDSKPLTEKSTATQFTVENMDRGAHTVQAAIVDEEGATLQSTESVTFHLQRFSVLKP